jgi:hypothetical protein
VLVGRRHFLFPLHVNRWSLSATASASTESAASSSVEPAASVESAAMETSKARLPAESVASRDSALCETAERAGVHRGRSTRTTRFGSAKRLVSVNTSAGAHTVIEIGLTRAKAISVDDGCAV